MKKAQALVNNNVILILTNELWEMCHINKMLTFG